MTLQSSLKLKIDRPVWEWLRFLPVSTSATSAFCFGDNLQERYLYYLAGSTLYRYDLISDSYIQLASIPTAPVTFVTLRYSSYGGYRGYVLGATANTLVIPGLGENFLVGTTIRLTEGLGAGQERKVTGSVREVVDHGVATAVATSSISDNTKKWRFNQWSGYQVRLVYSTGQSQVRRVLYNDQTTLYFYDANFQQLDPWCNTLFVTAPVTTAGAQTHFVIEKSTVTVDTPWDTTPDLTTSFVAMTGGIWAFSSAAAAPWTTLQYYDVATDTWTVKTALSSLVVAAYGTDASIERTGEYAGTFASGTATAVTTRTLSNSFATMDSDQYANFQIRITGGTGRGQRRRIVQNSGTTFYVDTAWDITPDSSSTYAVYGNTDRMYLMGGGLSSLFKYNIEKDIWLQANSVEFGITTNMAAKMDGQEQLGVSSATRTTTGITGINPVPVAAGTGYVVGEIITLTTGSSGKVRVTSIGASGAVTGLELVSSGSGYSVATFAQSATSGVGTGCTCAVLIIGTVARVTTITNHNLAIGDQVKFYGASESTWASYTYFVAGVDSLTTFTITCNASASAAAANSQSTTVVVDSTKNWTVNEHVGRLVQVHTSGYNGTIQIRRITANTATTLTLQSAITAAVSGTSRYVITEPQAFGRAIQYKVQTLTNTGKATGGTTTTLGDSSKTWETNQWLGYKVRVYSGTGYGAEVVITSNTQTTLTYATQTFTPDSTSAYIIMDSFGLMTATTNTTNATITDTTKLWGVNIWAGKRLRITSGTGTGQEITITSNTATVLTCTGVFTTAPSTDSTYSILENPVRGAGIEMNWVYGCSNTKNKGRYIYVPRGGGSNLFDRYDMTDETYDITTFMSPMFETFTTGTMYAYDGGDYIYIQPNATNRILRLNVVTRAVESAGVAPYTMGTALIGNRMEIVDVGDGVKLLYMARHSGQEFWRSLIYW